MDRRTTDRRCAHCGEVIGVYESIRVVLSDGTSQRGSKLTLRGALDSPGNIAVHEACYAPYQTERETDERL
jgi:hypothetical protein